MVMLGDLDRMAAGPVSRTERQLAHSMSRDAAQFERRSVVAATKLGFKLMQSIIPAFRRRDPAVLEKVPVWFRRMEPVLADIMTVAYLQGMAADHKPRTLSLSVHSKAIKALKVRLGVPPEMIRGIAATCKREAVSVLNKSSDLVERRLQTAILEVTKRGEHVRQGVKRLHGTFGKLGITPRNSFQLETIFRTQTQTAYSAGRWRTLQDPAVQEILWGYKLVTVGDDRVRDEHEPMDGTTLPKDDPYWDANWPPNGWACRCQTIGIYEERDHVVPPGEVEIEGKMVRPGADKGFQYNPGRLFREMEGIQLKPRILPKPKLLVPKPKLKPKLPAEISEEMREKAVSEWLAAKTHQKAGKSALVTRVLDEAPVYEGRCFRGVRMTDEAIEEIRRKRTTGKLLTMERNSSASESREVAEYFGYTGMGGKSLKYEEFQKLVGETRVVLFDVKTKGAADIRAISNKLADPRPFILDLGKALDVDEVVLRGGSRYKIVGMKEFKYTPPRSAWSKTGVRIQLEEVVVGKPPVLKPPVPKPKIPPKPKPEVPTPKPSMPALPDLEKKELFEKLRRDLATKSVSERTAYKRYSIYLRESKTPRKDFGTFFKRAKWEVETGKASPITGKPPAPKPVRKVPAKVEKTPEQWAGELTYDQEVAINMWEEDVTLVSDVRRMQAGKAVEYSSEIEVRAILGDLESAMAKAPKYEGKVYRGIRADLKYKRGDEFVMDAMSSSTKRQDTAASYVTRRLDLEKNVLLDYKGPRTILEIQSKTGVDIGPAAAIPKQAEVLLRKGSKYRVKSSSVETFTDMHGKPFKATRIVVGEI